jgi:hypothetical protein
MQHPEPASAMTVQPAQVVRIGMAPLIALGRFVSLKSEQTTARRPWIDAKGVSRSQRFRRKARSDPSSGASGLMR